MGPFGVYWMFAGFCAVNCIFCILMVPETKGKTLEEITEYFGAPTNSQGTTTTKSHHYDNPVFTIEHKEEENKLQKFPYSHHSTCTVRSVAHMSATLVTDNSPMTKINLQLVDHWLQVTDQLMVTNPDAVDKAGGSHSGQ
ncbi:hypothetical protein Pcinc_007467 [Petrolisthes cinctipes]|uniref:Uncharacterized protein n=2 Tax=Petrolisthes cinctipes TaxID=88211 RepID=A0AAE1GAU8_PETCI|nr:hypothetical protein Pcinc_007467 [Petrolisthes cinctipes]